MGKPMSKLQLNNAYAIKSIPTVGFNVETVAYQNVRFNVSVYFMYSLFLETTKSKYKWRKMEKNKCFLHSLHLFWAW
jgi:hypothetical protein